MRKRRTEQLIAQLGSSPPEYSRSYTSVVLVGSAVVALSVVLLFSLFWLGPRTDLAEVMSGQQPVFMLKLLFGISVAAGALSLLRDLAVPGRRVKHAALIVTAPFAILAVLGLRELLSSPEIEVHEHFTGSHWLECLWQAPALSLPVLLMFFAVMRRLAPTDLLFTGAAVGLFAGGLGVAGYALHCTDDSFAFVAVFYAAAVFEMALLGGLLGPRGLRWA